MCKERNIPSLITKRDLKALGYIALHDISELQSRTGKDYGKPLLVALCQGAALHFLDGTSRVSDLDVWVFFSGNAANDKFPHRRRRRVDFGNAHSGDLRNRPVDLLGRSIPHKSGESAIDSVRKWLRGRNPSPQMLRRKACIAIWPETLLGYVVWPVPEKELR